MKNPIKILRRASLGSKGPKEQSELKQQTPARAALQCRSSATQDHFAHAVVDAGEGQGAESNAQVAAGMWDRDVAGNLGAHYVISAHGKW